MNHKKQKAAPVAAGEGAPTHPATAAPATHAPAGNTAQSRTPEA